MREFFAALTPWATLVFAVASMLAVGMRHSFSEILEPLRNWPRVIGAISTNFVLAPALAYLLFRLLALDRPLAVGLFIAGSAAGAPFLLKLAKVARADVAFSTSLLLLLLPTTVLFLPIAVTLVAPGVEVSASAIALPLVLSMLLPLAVGNFLRTISQRLVDKARPFMNKLVNVSLIFLFVGIAIANLPALLHIGIRPIIAAVVFVLGTLVLGWLLGSHTPESRDVVALGTAQRNIAAATVVATQSFDLYPGVLVMVTTTAFVGMVVLFPVAYAMGRSGLARSLRQQRA